MRGDMNKVRMLPDIGQRCDVMCDGHYQNLTPAKQRQAEWAVSVVDHKCSPFRAVYRLRSSPLGLLVFQRYNDQLSMSFGSHLNCILPELQLENRRFRWETVVVCVSYCVDNPAGYL